MLLNRLYQECAANEQHRSMLDMTVQMRLHVNFYMQYLHGNKFASIFRWHMPLSNRYSPISGYIAATIQRCYHIHFYDHKIVK